MMRAGGFFFFCINQEHIKNIHYASVRMRTAAYGSVFVCVCVCVCVCLCITAITAH